LTPPTQTTSGFSSGLLPTQTEELVTPVQAQVYLDSSIGNRLIATGRVIEWSNEMRDDHWQFPAAPLMFNENNQLMDGHHRLRAVISYGKPVKFVVWRNTPTTLMAVIDDGRPRTLGDWLAFMGVLDPKVKAAALLKIVQYDKTKTFTEDRGGTKNARINRSSLVAAWDTYKDEVESVTPYGHKIERQIGIPTAIASATFAVLARQSPDNAINFWEQLGTGANLAEDDPIFALRRQLIKAKQSRSSGAHRQDRRTDTQMAALTIKAWNYWLEGRPVQNLVWRPVGPMAEAFPVPRKP
jgi:hypothetical protein